MSGIPWPTPNCIWPTSGHAEGVTELNAFDNALLQAGIGNLNLVKLSSIVPANVERLKVAPKILEGSLVPTVYTVKMSSTPGDVVAAAVGIGFSKGGHGMIFENTGGSKAAVEDTVTRMVIEGFARRGMQLDGAPLVFSSEHTVERIGCALAAVVLWWK